MSEEARKVAWKAFIDAAEAVGYSVKDDLANRSIFAGGWNAHAEHTGAIIKAAENLTDSEGFIDIDDLKTLAAEVKRLDKWRIALESLTAQGSEFHNDLDACLAYIEKRRTRDHEQRKALHKEVKRLREGLAHYAATDSDTWQCEERHICYGTGANCRAAIYVAANGEDDLS